MTIEEFAEVVEVEGLAYAVCYYLGTDQLKSLDDPFIVERALAAREALTSLEYYLEDKGYEL